MLVLDEKFVIMFYTIYAVPINTFCGSVASALDVKLVTAYSKFGDGSSSGVIFDLEVVLFPEANFERPIKVKFRVVFFGVHPEIPKSRANFNTRWD